MDRVKAKANSAKRRVHGAQRSEHSAKGMAHSAESIGQRAERPSGIGESISPRLNKRSKAFNWARGVNMAQLIAKKARGARLKAEANSAFPNSPAGIPIPTGRGGTRKRASRAVAS